MNVLNGRMTERTPARGSVEAMAHVARRRTSTRCCVLRTSTFTYYCRFWELDGDHDFLIDKEDLLRYGNHALTYRVDRVFAEARGSSRRG